LGVWVWLVVQKKFRFQEVRRGSRERGGQMTRIRVSKPGALGGYNPKGTKSVGSIKPGVNKMMTVKRTHVGKSKITRKWVRE